MYELKSCVCFTKRKMQTTKGINLYLASNPISHIVEEQIPFLQSTFLFTAVTDPPHCPIQVTTNKRGHEKV